MSNFLSTKNTTPNGSIYPFTNKLDNFIATTNYNFQFYDMTISDRWSKALTEYNTEQKHIAAYCQNVNNTPMDQSRMMVIMFGRDELGRSVSVQVDNFRPFVYVQFLTKDSENDRSIIMEYICKKIIKNGAGLDYEFERKFDSNGFTPTSMTNPDRKQFLVAKLYLVNLSQFRALKAYEMKRQELMKIVLKPPARFISSGNSDVLVLMEQVDILETDVPLTHKFVEQVGVKFNQWVCIDQLFQVDQYYTTTQIEFQCTTKNIKPSEKFGPSDFAPFRIASFDTEWYTPHISAQLPGSDVKERRFVQKGTVEDSLINFTTCVQEYGKTEVIDILHYVKSPFHDQPVYDLKELENEEGLKFKRTIKTFEYSNQWDCINGWATHLNEDIDVDFLTYWNGNFDLVYLKSLVDLLGDPISIVSSYLEYIATSIRYKKKNGDHDTQYLTEVTKQLNKRFMMVNVAEHCDKKKELLQLLNPKQAKDSQQRAFKKSPAFVYHEIADDLKDAILPSSLFNMNTIRNAWLAMYKGDDFEGWFANQRIHFIDRFEAMYQKALTIRNPLKSKLYSMGKIIGNQPVYTKKALNNSAKGENNIKYFMFDGIIAYDMMHQVKDRKKFDEYSLKYCAKNLLKNEAKIDLPPNRISEDYESADCAELYRYAIVDAELPLLIGNSLKIVLDMIVSSQGVFVDIKKMVISGEQIKTWCLLSYFGHLQNIVMSKDLSGQHLLDKNDRSRKSKYSGATVLTAVAGMHDKPIFTSDFGSLYPSIMIENNICCTSLVYDEKFLSIPNITYNKIEISEGVFAYFVTHVEGLSVQIQKYLKERRVDLRKEQAKHPYESPEWWVYEIRQTREKLNMNAIYGFFGVSFGFRPVQAVSAAVTSKGRGMLVDAVTYHNEYTLQHGLNTEVVYGDTDSIMLKAHDYDGSPLGISMSIIHGKKLARYVTSRFGGAITLEHENIYYPYVLYTKKKYIGRKYTQSNFEITLVDGTILDGRNKDIDFEDIDPQQVVSAKLIKAPQTTKKGVESVRRDKFKLMRETHGNSVELLLDFKMDELKKYVLEQINKIVENKVSTIDYSASGQLKKRYKDPPSHAVARDKMRDRNPGSEPMNGDRIYFVYMEMPIGVKRKKCAFDLKYAVDMADKMKIDRLAYLDLMRNPICQLLEPMFPNAGKWFNIAHDMARGQLNNNFSLTNKKDSFIELVAEFEKKYNANMGEAPQKRKRIESLAIETETKQPTSRYNQEKKKKLVTKSFPIDYLFKKPTPHSE